jgi:hypothetical protein
MFATIKGLIPEPRQADQPRHYIGRHRQPETITARATVTVIPGTVPVSVPVPVSLPVSVSLPVPGEPKSEPVVELPAVG